MSVLFVWTLNFFFCRFRPVQWPTCQLGAPLLLHSFTARQPLYRPPSPLPHCSLHLHTYSCHQRYRHWHVGHDCARWPLPHLLTTALPCWLLPGPEWTLPGQLFTLSPLLQQRYWILPVLHDVRRRWGRPLAPPDPATLHQCLDRLSTAPPLTAKSKWHCCWGRRKPQQLSNQYVCWGSVEAILNNNFSKKWTDMMTNMKWTADGALHGLDFPQHETQFCFS